MPPDMQIENYPVYSVARLYVLNALSKPVGKKKKEKILNATLPPLFIKY